MSRFSVENFLSHSTETFRRGTRLSFRKILLAKLLMHEKGRYHDFPSKFCLTVAKNFVGEPFSVSLISGIEKFYASEGYVTIFRRKFFCLSTETFRRGTLLCCVSENFW